MTPEEQRAIHDAYSTLRAIANTYGIHDDVIAGMCAESERLLVEVFPSVATFERMLDEEQAT